MKQLLLLIILSVSPTTAEAEDTTQRLVNEAVCRLLTAERVKPDKHPEWLRDAVYRVCTSAMSDIVHVEHSKISPFFVGYNCGFAVATILDSLKDKPHRELVTLATDVCGGAPRAVYEHHRRSSETK